MKICIFATSLAATGGIESHLLLFSEKLSKRNHQLTLICGNCRINPQWEQKLRRIANCRLTSISNPWKRKIWQVWTGLKLRGSGFDAVYTNGQGSSVYWFTRALGVKNWIHHHHMAADYEDQQNWTGSYRLALAKCRKLIACASVNARRLERLIGRSAEVVYCFSRQVNYLERPPAKERKLNFGYFGRLIPAKGLPVILRLSQDPDLQFIEWHVWGSGGDFDPSHFAESSAVHFHGSFSTESELEAVIQQLDAFVLFSTFYEGLPITLIEAIGGGLPWIATERGGIAELSSLSEDLILLSSSPDDEECKKACLKMRDRLVSGSTDGRQLTRIYADRFSDSALVQKWEACLEDAHETKYPR